jgi:hypothetical protein
VLQVFVFTQGNVYSVSAGISKGHGIFAREITEQEALSVKIGQDSHMACMELAYQI